MTVHFSVLPTCFILPSFLPSNNPFVFPPLIRDFTGSFAVSLSLWEFRGFHIRHSPATAPQSHSSSDLAPSPPPSSSTRFNTRSHLVLILILAHPCGASSEASCVAMFSSPTRQQKLHRNVVTATQNASHSWAKMSGGPPVCVKINLSPHACM